MQGFRSRFVGSHQPKSAFFEPFQCPRKIDDLDERHAFGGARRNFPNRRRQSRCAIAWDDYAYDARGIRRAETRAQIVRILNAIEYEHERRRACAVQYLIERSFAERADRFKLRNRALMRFAVYALIQFAH